MPTFQIFVTTRDDFDDLGTSDDKEGVIWYNSVEKKLKIYLEGEPRVIQLIPPIQ